MSTHTCINTSMISRSELIHVLPFVHDDYLWIIINTHVGTPVDTQAKQRITGLPENRNLSTPMLSPAPHCFDTTILREIEQACKWNVLTRTRVIWAWFTLTLQLLISLSKTIVSTFIWHKQRTTLLNRPTSQIQRHTV